MRLTFTCEKCGKVLEVAQDVFRSDFDERGVLCLRAFPELIRTTCPVCNPPEPSYGPLTVEPMKEALRVASDRAHPGTHGRYHEMARFVLRLLDKIDKRGDSYCRLINTAASARRELLSLAKEDNK